MKLFTFFLYAICLICLFWGILFFSGPSLVSWAIVSYSKGQIIPSNVIVTPRLDVKISRANFEFEQISGQPGISGFARAIEISWSLSRSKPLLYASIGPTTFNQGNFVDKIDVLSESLGDFDMNNIKYEIKVTKLVSKFYGVSFDEIIGTGSYSKDDFSDDLSFQIRNTRFEDKKIIFSDIDLNILPSTADVTKADLSVVFLPEELKINEFFIGSLPKITVKGKVELDHENSMALSVLSFALDETDRLNLTGSAELTAQVHPEEKLLNCLSLECGVDELLVNYKINFGDEGVIGSVECTSSPCSFEDISYRLQTSNTSKLFDNLAGSRILNPLFVAYLYSLFRGGDQVGNGHVVNL